MPTVRPERSSSLVKRESSRTTVEERINAIHRVIGLVGAPMPPEGIPAVIAGELAELSRSDLERAVKLLARDEDLTKAVRFGYSVALSDFYRVLKREDPVPDAISVEEACRLQPALAESIRAGEITSIEGRKIERNAQRQGG